MFGSYMYEKFMFRKLKAEFERKLKHVADKLEKAGKKHWRPLQWLLDHHQLMLATWQTHFNVIHSLIVVANTKQEKQSVLACLQNVKI